MGAVVRRLSMTRAIGFEDRLGLHFIGMRLFVVGVGSLELKGDYLLLKYVRKGACFGFFNGKISPYFNRSRDYYNIISRTHFEGSGTI